ncbi:hypothetical protein TYRP_023230, partial [Tyrophagus putrescentiae]
MPSLAKYLETLDPLIQRQRTEGIYYPDGSVAAHRQQFDGYRQQDYCYPNYSHQYYRYQTDRYPDYRHPDYRHQDEYHQNCRHQDCRYQDTSTRISTSTMDAAEKLCPYHRPQNDLPITNSSHAVLIPNQAALDFKSTALLPSRPPEVDEMIALRVDNRHHISARCPLLTSAERYDEAVKNELCL